MTENLVDTGTEGESKYLFFSEYLAQLFSTDSSVMKDTHIESIYS